jgi:hypothetical protein
MIAAVLLLISIILGLLSAAMGRVVWKGPPANVERPVAAWLGRVAVLVMLIAGTALAGYMYRSNRGPTVFDAMSSAAEEASSY